MCSMRHGLEAAGVPQHVMRKARMNAGELRQRRLNGTLADGKIRIRGPLPLLIRGKARAHAQARVDEVEQNGNLGLSERVAAVVSAHYLRGSCQRVGFAKHGVSSRHRQFIYSVADEHVAKIDNAGN